MGTTKKKSKDRRSRSQRKKGWRTASSSDRHELYELSVQNTEAEVEFIDKVWTQLRGRLASSIREDFCGTAAASAEWVLARDDNTAIGFDLDQEVLDWGIRRNSERLDEEQLQRLQVHNADVRAVQAERVQTILAMNFSYFLFKTREDLRQYFEHAREGLLDDGIFILDAYGGSESYEEMEEEKDLDGFTYVWDQASYDPITGDVVNHIHFRFPDETEMTKAFTYEWRLWSLPEIRELLEEAGFTNVTVWWEGNEEDSEEGNGVFEPAEHGEACPGWIVYITAEKSSA